MASKVNRVSINGVDIRNIKEWEGHEGPAWQCDVYLDGKLLGKATDDGWGGEVALLFPNRSESEDLLLERIRPWWESPQNQRDLQDYCDEFGQEMPGWEGHIWWAKSSFFLRMLLLADLFKFYKKWDKKLRPILKDKFAVALLDRGKQTYDFCAGTKVQILRENSKTPSEDIQWFLSFDDFVIQSRGGVREGS